MNNEKVFKDFLKAFNNNAEEENDEDVGGSEAIDFADLTAHQADIMDQMIQAILRGEKKIILNGSAGVGKTFLVKYLIQKLYNTKKRGNFAYITAPTNRAVSVLESKSPNYPYWMKFSTIHKALYMKRIINEKDGTIHFKPDFKPRGEQPFQDGFVIIVDEASMLNSEILFYLEDHQYAHITMIFIGDNKQLNPINEPESPIFVRPLITGKQIKFMIGEKEIVHTIPKYVQFSLTEIIRQAEGNPIIELSNNLPAIGLMEAKILEDGTGYSYSSDYEDAVARVADNEDYRYISWTNFEVDRFNFEARKKLYFNPSKVELNETLVFSAPYEGNMMSYSNNAEIKVNSLKIVDGEFIALNKFKPNDSPAESDDYITIKEKLTYYLVNNDIKIIHESSERDLKDIMFRLKALTKVGLTWKAWYDFSEEFAQVGYRYASTVHKAQGGTFDTVYINMKDLNKNRNIPEKRRMWYTAVTRAAKNIVFYNERSYNK